MHELDIACKNVLISYSSMMHAYAYYICNLLSTCMFPLTLAKEPHYSDDFFHLTEAERSFSGLRRLKNYMRSTMKEDRLNGLALMMVHRTISVSVENNICCKAYSKNAIGTYISKWVSFRENEKWRIYIYKVIKMLHV